MHGVNYWLYSNLYINVIILHLQIPQVFNTYCISTTLLSETLHPTIKQSFSGLSSCTRPGHEAIGLHHSHEAIMNRPETS